MVFIAMKLDVIPKELKVDRGKRTETEDPPTFRDQLAEEEPKEGQRRSSQ